MELLNPLGRVASCDEEREWSNCGCPFATQSVMFGGLWYVG